MINLGNLHPTSLCDEPRLWWLGFLLSSFVMVIDSREAIYPSL